jgi:general nucleoside transport system ATP-binding protein
MDEPTAVLAPHGNRRIVRNSALDDAQGKSIIFISHKLQEVTAIADRVTRAAAWGGDRQSGVPAKGVTARNWPA